MLKRTKGSIILPANVREMSLADCNRFLSSEGWYTERGIPYRRGYLFHGVPGSGKTSLIQYLAGELGLDIYSIPLSWMNDSTLVALVSYLPPRCILLLEDVDAAFIRPGRRDASTVGLLAESNIHSNTQLSLSGLLNVLDGFTAAEGCLTFATTNHRERLDPALIRPGRMDVQQEFTHATQEQVMGLFLHFFAPTSMSDEISELASRFSAAIPEGTFSAASIHGFLLGYSINPGRCVEEVADWVVQEQRGQALFKALTLPVCKAGT